MNHVNVPTFNIERLHHIMVDQLKVLMADPVLYIALAASEEIIHHCHFMTIHHQLISEVRAHESCPTGDLPEERLYISHMPRLLKYIVS